MKKIVLIFIFLLIFTIPCNAIHGYISLDIDFLEDYDKGVIYLAQDFNNFTVGGRMETDLMGFGSKLGFIPSGIPKSQRYDLILKYKFNNITFRFIEGCNHYFSQSEKSFKYDERYTKVGVKYEF